MRFDPVHRRAKELIESGVIGDIITFRTTIGNAGPEGWSPDRDAWFFDKDKAAMGALSDLGIHKLDLLQYLGAVGTMAASWTVYGKECNSTCLYGTKGIMLIYSDPGAPIVVRDMSNTSTAYSFEPTTRSGVIDEFVDALEHDRDPEVSGKKALTIMRTIFGSIKSSDISRTVAVNSTFVSHL